MKRCGLFVLVFVLGFALCWVLSHRPAGPGTQPAWSPESHAAFVVYPLDGKQYRQSLVINRIQRDNGAVTDFAPVDMDGDWYIEVGGAIYWCSARK